MLPLLIAALAASPSLGLGLGNTPQGAPPVDSVDWTSIGQTSSAWYGAPTPDLDCMVQPDGGGALTCPHTMTGVPTLSTGYGYPTQPTAAVLDGSGPGWDLGVVGNSPSETWTSCTIFTAADLTSYHDLLTHMAGGVGWQSYTSGTSLVYLFNDGAAPYLPSTATLQLGAWNVSCVYVEPGKVYVNTNGTGAGSAATGLGAISAPTAHFDVGLNVGDAAWAGKLIRQTVWTNWTPGSAAGLAKLVASMQAKLTNSGGLVTFAGDGGYCCQTASSCYLIANNVPCITSAGVWLSRSGSNLVTYSEGFDHWTKNGSETVTLADPDCPISPGGIRMASIATTDVAGGIYQYSSGLSGAYSASLWLATYSGDPACQVSFINSYGTPGAGSDQVGLSATPTRYSWVGAPSEGGNGGIQIWRSAASTCTRWCLWGAQHEAGSKPTLYHPTAGAPYSGSQTVARFDLGALAGATRWAVFWRGTAADWLTSPTSSALWSTATLYSPGETSTTAYLGALSFYIRDDAAGVRQWDTGAALSAGERAILLEHNAPSERTRFWVDGIEVSSTLSEAGVANSGLVTPFVIGAGNADTNHLDGWVKRVAICKKKGGCR